MAAYLQPAIIRFASGAEKLYQRPSFEPGADTMSHVHQLHEAITAATKTLQSLADLNAQVEKAADLIEQCLRAGNKLLVCGNGGSAADAAHFATELVVRFARDRRAHPAICLASEGGLLTAAANDYGFNEIFARQVVSRETCSFASQLRANRKMTCARLRKRKRAN